LPLLAVAVTGKERVLEMGMGLEMERVMGQVLEMGMGLETGPGMALEMGRRRQQPDRPAVSLP
jgi:hypothetical protein